MPTDGTQLEGEDPTNEASSSPLPTVKVQVRSYLEVVKQSADPVHAVEKCQIAGRAT